MSTHDRRSVRGRTSLLVGFALIVSSLLIPATAQAFDPGGYTLTAPLKKEAGGAAAGTFNMNLNMSTNEACFEATGVALTDPVNTPAYEIDIVDLRNDQVKFNFLELPLFTAGAGSGCANDFVSDAVMQDIFNHAEVYAVLVYVETIPVPDPSDFHVDLGGEFAYTWNTVNVDITTKTCPIAIQSAAQLSGHEGDCSAVALPGFDYRVTDSKSLNAKIDDASHSGDAYRYSNVAEGAVEVTALNAPDGYRVGTATSGTATVGGGNTGPWTFAANGNEDLTVYMFREPDAPPIATAPVTKFRTGTQYSPAAVRVSWTGADVATIDHFTLQRSVDGGAYATVFTGTATSFDTTMSANHSYRFRVLATDDKDQTSGYKTGSKSTLKSVQDISSRIDYGGSWAKKTSSSYSGGSTHKASTAGKTASLSFTGRAVAWVAPQSLTRGKAKVYIDGKYKTTIDLGKTAANRIVQYTTTWSSAGSHKITIKVVGTSGRPRVDLDTFLYLS